MRGAAAAEMGWEGIKVTAAAGGGEGEDGGREA